MANSLNKITTKSILDATVATADIAADAVTGAKIADDAVGAEHIEQLDADLSFADSAKAKFGTGNDIEIYHSSANAHINHVSSGSMYIDSVGDHNFRNTAGTETRAKFSNNGSVDLYYDNSKKFETTNTGVTVHGGNSAFLVQGSGEVQMAVGSTNAGGAAIYFDGDSNGDWSGSDYSHIMHNVAGDMEYNADNPSGATNHIFKAAGTEKIRFQAAGGISFNGDTSANNSLDDYEEGTFTPTAAVGTFTIEHATYTKIGRSVTYQIYGSFSSSSSGTSQSLTGFPFTMLSGTYYSCAVNSNTGAGAHPVGQLAANTDTLLFKDTSNNAFNGGDMGGHFIVLSGVFQTT